MVPGPGAFSAIEKRAYTSPELIALLGDAPEAAMLYFWLSASPLETLVPGLLRGPALSARALLAANYNRPAAEIDRALAELLRRGLVRIDDRGPAPAIYLPEKLRAPCSAPTSPKQVPSWAQTVLRLLAGPLREEVRADLLEVTAQAGRPNIYQDLARALDPQPSRLRPVRSALPPDPQLELPLPAPAPKLQLLQELQVAQEPPPLPLVYPPWKEPMMPDSSPSQSEWLAFLGLENEPLRDARPDPHPRLGVDRQPAALPPLRAVAPPEHTAPSTRTHVAAQHPPSPGGIEAARSVASVKASCGAERSPPRSGPVGPEQSSRFRHGQRAETTLSGTLELLPVWQEFCERIPQLRPARRQRDRLKGEITTGLPGDLHQALVQGFMETQNAEPPATLEDFRTLGDWILKGGLDYLPKPEWCAHFCKRLPVLLEKSAVWLREGRPDPHGPTRAGAVPVRAALLSSQPAQRWLTPEYRARVAQGEPVAVKQLAELRKLAGGQR